MNETVDDTEKKTVYSKGDSRGDIIGDIRGDSIRDTGGDSRLDSSGYCI